MHTIYEVVDASVSHSSGGSKTLRVKLTVSPEPAGKRREGPPTVQGEGLGLRVSLLRRLKTLLSRQLPPTPRPTPLPPLASPRCPLAVPWVLGPSAPSGQRQLRCPERGKKGLAPGRGSSLFSE